jgi:peroxiredoxin
VQLVELQSVLKKLREKNIELFAISYDSVDTLADFAQRNGIKYSLLADEGSQVIRALGMLDEDLDAHHAAFGGQVRDDQRGVSYPGVFILDEDGVVTERRFQRNYRVREAGGSLLAAIVEDESYDSAPASTSEGSPVRVSAHLDSPTYWRYQRVHVIVDVTIAPGAHVFAPGSHPDYIPLTVEVSAERGEIGDAELPESVPFKLEGLDDELRVYERSIRISVPLELIMERGEPMDEQTIGVRVRYQACVETTCYPPAEATLELKVSARPDVA